MYRVSSLLALALMISATGALQAQDTTGFPAERVRWKQWERNDNGEIKIPGVQPFEKYTENRIVIKEVNVDTDGSDFAISGEIFTDFEIDEAPSGFKSGQMMGIKIDVRLYEFTSPFKRKSGIVQLPKLSPTDYGEPVEGQRATAIVTEEVDEYGLATFELPAMDGPLPPGVYRLIATISFGTQDKQIIDGLQWCSHWYGSEMNYNEITLQDEEFPIFEDKELREKHHKEIIGSLKKISDETTLYVGQMLDDDKVTIRTKTKGDKLVNLVRWNRHVEICSWLQTYEKQLAGGSEILANLLAADGLDRADKKRIKKNHDDGMARVEGSIRQYGGKMEKGEVRMLEAALSDRTVVLEQVMNFEELLTEKYWILSEGVLLYAGFNTINHVGYTAWDACTNHDINKWKDDREVQLDQRREGEDGLPGYKKRRDHNWRYYHPAIKKHAFKYMDTRIEKSDWDAKKFCMKEGKNVMLDEEKWATFSSEWINDFLTETDKMLREVDTSEKYAIRKWKDAYENAEGARGDCITQVFSWEFFNLTDRQQVPAKEITDAWAEQNEGAAVDLSEFFKNAAVSPSIIKQRFNDRLNKVRSATAQTEFKVAYRRIIDAANTPD
ncbi:MAG: hypothetical protein ACYTDT_03245 [Planctomycetota bacterium]|jgi:hypothetical protein